MPLGKKADAGDYVKDFYKSKAPQFKGKSKNKRRQMAIAAYLDARDKGKAKSEEMTFKVEVDGLPAMYIDGASAQANIRLNSSGNDVDFIVSGGRSKGYDNAWYDPNSHIYVFQNYGNGTEFGHFKIICDEKSKLFKGYESAVKNSVSHAD